MTSIDVRDEDHWHELRAQHVGSSEIAALFDASPYLTRLELYLRKQGKIAGGIPDSERMFWGRTLEDAIAQGVHVLKCWEITSPKQYYISDRIKGLGCTPDRFALRPDRETPGIIEIKNVDGLEFRRWEDGEPPLNYLLQLQQQLACTGFTWGAIAALVGGNELKIFPYERHEGAITKIEQATTQFWADLEAGIEPKAVADDYDIVRDLYPQAAKTEVDLSGDNELPEICARLKSLSASKSAAEKEERACKAVILQKLGDAEIGRCSGFLIKAPTISKKEYTVAATSYRQLTVKEIEA